MANIFPTDFTQKLVPDANDAILLADSGDSNKIKRGAWEDFKGATGAKIVSASFLGNDIVFVLDDTTTALLPNGKTTLTGPTGDNVELRVDSGYIQWKETLGVSWTNLVALSTLKGDTGAGTEMQVSGGYIQRRPIGSGSWNNIIALSALVGNGIVSVLKTLTVGKVDTYTITYDDSTTDTFTVTNGNDGANGTNGTNGMNAAEINSASFVGNDMIFVKSDTSTFSITNAKVDLKGDDGVAGPVGMVWKGAWSAGTYSKDDGVSKDGSSFIANKSTSQTPSLGATDWDTLAQKGASGTGTGDMLASTYDALGLAKQVAFADDLTPLVTKTGAETITNKNLTDASNRLFKTGTVATAAATAAKVVTLDSPDDSITPTAGELYLITYTLGTTASSPTLAVNGGAAKAIRLGNTAANNIGHTAAAGGSIMYRYDGTAFQMIGSNQQINTDTNTTYIESTTGVAVTNATQTAAVNTLYYANNATKVTFTLPATCPINSVVEIVGMHATGTWTITAPSGDNIIIEGSDTGSAGVLTGDAQTTVKLRCTVANTTWVVTDYTGIITTNTGYSTEKVSAEAGKGLSQENYTTTEKSKLGGIATGATANDTDANLKNRANHTGTQTASTISDFSTAVSSNSAVAANTAKITNATHTGDVTGSTVLTIANGAVTKAKTDSGVQASLGKADTALQIGDIGTTVGYLNIPSNLQSANYTLVLGDAGKSIDHPSSDANARTFTIPANSSVAYPIGTTISFSNMTSQVVTIAITTDTMYLAGTGTTGSRTLAQYGVATIRKLTSTTRLISGVGLT